jgi:hypothetical protein
MINFRRRRFSTFHFHDLFMMFIVCLSDTFSVTNSLSNQTSRARKDSKFCDRIIAFLADAFKTDFIDTETRKLFLPKSFPFPFEFSFQFLARNGLLWRKSFLGNQKQFYYFYRKTLSVFCDIESSQSLLRQEFFLNV